MSDLAFDGLVDAYEAMIDWPKRLANEQALFRRIFEQCNAKSVLDAACGTGHHAAAFRDWGLDVEGADASSEMIQRCRNRWRECDRLRWVNRRFELPADRTFDVVVCTGNSLALVENVDAMSRAVKTLLACVRKPGGALVIHLLNLWSLVDGENKWQKCVRTNLPQGGDSLIIKGVQRIGSRGRVNMLVTNLLQPPVLQAHTAPFLGVDASELASACQSGGADRVQLFGGYQNQIYDTSTSVDLIVVAWK